MTQPLIAYADKFPPSIYDKCDFYKNTPGVYLLLFENNKIYIGASMHVGKRLRRHLKSATGAAIKKTYIVVVGSREYVFEIEKRFLLRYGESKRIQNISIPTSTKQYIRKRDPIAEKALLVGLDPSLVRNRLRSGWTEEQALTTPKRPPFKGYTYKDKSYRADQIEEEFGIKYVTFQARLQKGMSVTEAIETPVPKRRKNEGFDAYPQTGKPLMGRTPQPKEEKEKQKPIKFPSEDKETNWRWAIGALQSVAGKTDPGSLKAQDTYIRALKILASED